MILIIARVDLAGGWSDTPPITYEHGGVVVNAAVKIDGKVINYNNTWINLLKYVFSKLIIRSSDLVYPYNII